MGRNDSSGSAMTVRCMEWNDNSSDTAIDTSEMAGLSDGKLEFLG